MHSIVILPACPSFQKPAGRWVHAAALMNDWSARDSHCDMNGTNGIQRRLILVSLLFALTHTTHRPTRALLSLLHVRAVNCSWCIPCKIPGACTLFWMGHVHTCYSMRNRLHVLDTYSSDLPEPTILSKAPTMHAHWSNHISIVCTSQMLLQYHSIKTTSAKNSDPDPKDFCVYHLAKFVNEGSNLFDTGVCKKHPVGQ
jgi:hypothetical protein